MLRNLTENGEHHQTSPNLQMIFFLDILLTITGSFLHFIFRIFGTRLIDIIGGIWKTLAWHLFKKKSSTVEEELRLLFGDKFDDSRIKNIAKKSFNNYYRRQVENIFFGYLNKKTVEKMITAEGLQNLDAALARGKGVILLLSHFGSFLLPLPFLAYRGYKVNQITGKDIHSGILQERFWIWRKKQADRLPVNFIQVGNFLRPVYQSLKNNEIVAIAFDGRNSAKWIPVKLFNRTAIFSPGPINLALKTNAAIIPTFIINQNGKHRIILEPIFELRYTGSIEDDLKINVERYTQIFAKYLATYPCHMGMVLQKTRLYSENGLSSPLFMESTT